MVQPEVTGLLVTPGDAKGLAADIVRLASDRVYAAQLGEAGRRRATALYGARSTALASLDLYRGLRGTAPS
jgi:glycosyltransferase involved in cell wall biosynthesis